MIENGWGPMEIDTSNGEKAQGDGNPITIAGHTFANGLGVHAPSVVKVDLVGRCAGFEADVGVDDEVGDNGSVQFQVWGDGKKLFDSGVVTDLNPLVPVGTPRLTDAVGINQKRCSRVGTPGSSTRSVPRSSIVTSSSMVRGCRTKPNVR